MGLRISTNIASQAVLKNLRQVSDKGDASIARLSSGKRITKSADDAAGLAIAKKLEAETKGLRKAIRNSNDAVALIQTTEGGLNETSNMLVRLRELTIQAGSDTVGENERGYLDKEYQHLVEEIDRLAETTTFNGMNLLNGEGSGEMDFQVGNSGDELNRITFDSDSTNVTADQLGVSGTSVAEKGDALSAIGSIDEAIGKVSGHRGNLGAIQSRIQSTITNLETQAFNQDSARSVIEDADVAQEAANLASANVIKQAGIMTLAQANDIPNQALRLIS